MAFTKYTTSTANVAGLGDKPNTDDSLTPAQLKARFDKGSTDIATYLNDVLTIQIDSDLATKAEVAAVVVGGLSPDSITNAYLATDVKVGSLADLDTTAKTSITDAINELVPLETNNAIKFYGKYSQMSGGIYYAGAGQIITFSAEDNDDFNAINLGTSTSRITIPTGVTKVRFYIKANISSNQYNSGYDMTLSLYKNGSSEQVLGYAGNQTGGDSTVITATFFSTPITCIATNYFQIYAGGGGGALSAGSVFGMEVLG